MKKKIVTVVALVLLFFSVHLVHPASAKAQSKIRAVKSIPYQEFTEKDRVSFEIPPDTFYNPSGDTLFYSVDGLPKRLYFDEKTMKVIGTLDPTSIDRLYSATVNVRDRYGNTGSTKLSLTIKNVNEAPTARDLSSINRKVKEGEDFKFEIRSGTFFDLDNEFRPKDIPAESKRNSVDFLRYSAEGIPEGLFFVPGEIVYDPDTDEISEKQAFIYGTPEEVSTDTKSKVTVTVEDSRGATASTSFYITVLNVNNPPKMVKSISDKEFTEGDPVEIDLLGTFEDPDGGSLDYQIRGKLPRGLKFNRIAKKIEGSLEDKTAGEYKVTVVVSDSDGKEKQIGFTIKVKAIVKTGKPPEVENPISDKRATEGKPFTLTIPSGTFKDPDNDILRYRVPNLPKNLEFDRKENKIYGTLAKGTAGRFFKVIVTANDGHGNDTSTDFKLTVYDPEETNQEIAAATTTIEKLECVKKRQWAIGLDPNAKQADQYLQFFSARGLAFQFYVSINGALFGNEDGSAYCDNTKVLEEYIQSLGGTPPTSSTCTPGATPPTKEICDKVLAK